MTIPTTNVISLNIDVDGIRSRRDADLATSRVLKASCSEEERCFLLSLIDAKRREIEPLKVHRRARN